MEKSTFGHADWPLRIGLLLVSASLFAYMLYETVNGVINRGPLSNYYILITDVPGAIGMALRAIAGLIAVVTVLFFVVKRDLSRPEALTMARIVVLLEAGYWFASFIMSGVLGLVGFTSPSNDLAGTISGLLENTIPCLFQSIGLTAVLLRLFFALSSTKPLKGAIKWALIVGTMYTLVFWVNNSGNWAAAVIAKGTDYILLYPANLLSFLVTTVGLLVVALYAVWFTKRTIGADSISKINLHPVGVIITLTGMYFLGLYVMWLVLGSVGGWGAWYMWLLGHNLDLWAMSLPFVGLPLLFYQRQKVTVEA